MLQSINIKMTRRYGLRAAILQVLHVARPLECSETLITETISGTSEYGDVAPGELRREMDYLEDKGLIRIQDREARVWMAELTAVGVDVVEGTVKCPDGIAKIRWE